MKRAKIVFALLFLGCLGYAAYMYYDYWLGNGSDQALTLYGNVDIREVRLGFRVAGRLSSMAYEEGDRVNPGDLLATLDDEPMREALAVAEAGVLQARAGLARATSGSRPQEIQAASARVDEARSALANAEQELRRQQELTSKNLSSQRLLDSALATRDQAAARLDANEEALALAVEGFRREDIAEMEAALAAAVAKAAQAQTSLEDSRLYAPSAGVILTRAREPGAILSVGVPVYTLSLSEKVYVRAYIDDPNLGRLEPGAKVEVHTDSSDHVYHGQVGFIAPRAEFTPKSVETPQLRTDLVFRLRIVVEDADEALRQGMPVTVVFPEA